MSNKLVSLVTDLFKNQPDDIDIEVMPSEHWRKHIEGKEQLTTDDLALLMVSPTNRAVYHATYLEHLNSFIAKAANFNSVPRLRAAADSGDAIVIDGLAGFELSFVPVGRSVWKVILKVLRSDFPHGAVFSIRDRNGVIWLSGEPDKDGEVFAQWSQSKPPKQYIEDGMKPGVFVDGIQIIAPQ